MKRKIYDGCWSANSLKMNNSLYASFVTNFPGSFTVEVICSAPFSGAKSAYHTLFCTTDDSYSIYKNSAALTFKQTVATSRPSIASYNGSSVVAKIDGKTVCIAYHGQPFYSTTGAAITSTGERTWCIGGADTSHALTGEIFFKLFMNDVGLLSAMYMEGIQVKILNGETEINFGSVYENAVAQELTAHGFVPTYYNSSAHGEIDLVVERDGRVLPIKVKSGKHYKRHRALAHMMDEPEFGLNSAVVLDRIAPYPLFGGAKRENGV